jgi:hypothetical protein
VVAVTAGLEDADVERSPAAAAAASLGVKPKPSGDGRGVVERCLFRAGLETGAAEAWPGTGREPMGPTEPMDCLEAPWREEGESAAPGEDADVPGCSGKPALMAELGEEVLLARDGDCPSTGAPPA